MQALAAGKILNNRYRVKSVIGCGSTGYVYQCEDFLLEKDRAIKEALTAKERLKAEAKLLIEISNNPHVVRIIDYFEENSAAYMVMELIEGRILRDYMRHGLYLTEEMIRIVSWQLLIPLKALHKKGFVHLDVCPDNMIISDRVNLTLIREA